MQPPMKSTKVILIMEDEKPLARALELKFTQAGFLTHHAQDGEEGLKILEKEHIDLILCDLMMPKMNGFQVLESLKEKKKKIPVIVLTNLSQSEDEKRVRDLGVEDFLIKSNIVVVDIIEKVKKRLQM